MHSCLVIALWIAVRGVPFITRGSLGGVESTCNITPVPTHLYPYNWEFMVGTYHRVCRFVWVWGSFHAFGFMHFFAFHVCFSVLVLLYVWRRCYRTLVVWRLCASSVIISQSINGGPTLAWTLIGCQVRVILKTAGEHNLVWSAVNMRHFSSASNSAYISTWSLSHHLYTQLTHISCL
jgi:hypothetical protein